MLKTKQGLIYYEVDTKDSDILCFTTTRIGGFGIDFFDFGDNTNKELSEKNYALLCSVFNLPGMPEKVIQTHSANVLDLDKYYEKSRYAYDGMITSAVNVPLGILTADCYSVQIIGENLISNLHCGWRSVYSGIIENTLRLFQMKGEKTLKAVVGVGICSNCYEVSEDLAEKFESKFGFPDIAERKNGKFYLNLRKIIEKNLKRLGVSEIIHLQNCTFCNKYLYSFRRDRENAGRMITIIMRKG